jgi:hypothetical protein
MEAVGHGVRVYPAGDRVHHKVGVISSHHALLSPCGSRLEPLAQLRPAAPPGDAAHRDGNGFLLADQNDKPLAAGNAGIQQIALQHGVVLGHDRDLDGWIFGALALMDGRGIGRHQGVEFAKAVGDRTPIETGACRAAKTPAAKADARGSDKGCVIGVNRRREIITGEFRSA